MVLKMERLWVKEFKLYLEIGKDIKWNFVFGILKEFRLDSVVFSLIKFILDFLFI